MKKTFIKNSSYIGGIITFLFILTIALLSVIMFINEYDACIYILFLIILAIVYVPSFLVLIFLFGYKINFDDDGIYTTLFNKNKQKFIEYKNVQSVDIYTSRGLRIEITLNNNETKELEYKKEIVILLKEKCNDRIKDYIEKFLYKYDKKNN